MQFISVSSQQQKKGILKLFIFIILPAPVLFILYMLGFTFTLPVLVFIYVISLVATLALGRFKPHLVFGFLFGIGIIAVGFYLLCVGGGMGISNPPNKCDLQGGYEIREGKSILKRESCLYKLAQEKNDERVCENINNQDLIIECVAWVAITTKNPQLCQELSHHPLSVEVSGLPWVCLTKVAIGLHDKSLCDDIDDPISMALCKDYFNIH